jgi:hypothetical protein
MKHDFTHTPHLDLTFSIFLLQKLCYNNLSSIQGNSGQARESKPEHKKGVPIIWY